MPKNAIDFPHTIVTVIRIKEMLDSFLDLPKDKRPPESMWFKPEELENWLDHVFETKSTNIEIDLNDIEG